MNSDIQSVDRKSGVALWRQIADGIRSAIASGEFSEAGKLPGEIALAERFGVNRHTVRSAIAALQSEGVVKATPGKGTELLAAKRIHVPISRRTRFSAGLGKQLIRPELAFIASAIVEVPAGVSECLKLEDSARCIVLETLGLADGVPVSIAIHYFPEARFPEIDIHFRRERSITKAFAASGLQDYVRASTRISARSADEKERHWLKLSAGAIIMEAEAVNSDIEGVPVQYSRTRFSADRVRLEVDFDNVEP